jgi:type 1 glutamine amidotransferase
MGMKQCSLLLTAGTCAGVLAFAPACISANHETVALLPLASSTNIDGLVLTMRLFPVADVDQDGAVTRAELRSTLAQWFTAADTSGSGSVAAEQLGTALKTALSAPSRSPALGAGMRGGPQPQTANPATVQAMLMALPTTAPARPVRPRKVLVLGRAAGFVHSSIPLAAQTIASLGTKTGAWSTTISYDAADITAENLRQYDAVFLASTTGAFLDDKNDAALTATRRQALLDFVRSGKGLAGIHAASDAYHATAPGTTPGATPAVGMARARLPAETILATMMFSQGDRNHDATLNKAEINALADAWFDVLDLRKTGRLGESDFSLFSVLVPKSNAAAATPAAPGPDSQTGTWPEFNRMIGGYFKFHWLDPQLITVKIDDPKSPLTRMFSGREFDIRDEIYTMGAGSWSRDNVHVLTSIDYTKMSPEDKALEEHPRPDRDYGLSWIRREGRGRVFYEALGHSERIYAVTPVLEHLLAGMQYVLGDLAADDAPSAAAQRK